MRLDPDQAESPLANYQLDGFESGAGSGRAPKLSSRNAQGRRVDLAEQQTGRGGSSSAVLGLIREQIIGRAVRTFDTSLDRVGTARMFLTGAELHGERDARPLCMGDLGCNE
jgi:hypothetical protein